MRSVWVSIFLAVVFTAYLAGAENTALSTTTPRNLIKPQDDEMNPSGSKVDGDVGDVGLDDYGPFDPSPTTKRVPPEPIQHGTPLIPYIPKPSPSPPPPPRYEP